MIDSLDEDGFDEDGFDEFTPEEREKMVELLNQLNEITGESGVAIMVAQKSSQDHPSIMGSFPNELDPVEAIADILSSTSDLLQAEKSRNPTKVH